MKQNVPLTFEITVAGGWSAWQFFDPCIYYMIRDCAGNISVQVDNFPVDSPLVAGNVQQIPKKFRRMRVSSTLAETVYISVGDNYTRDSRKIINVGGGGGGSAFAQVGGPIAYGIKLALSFFNNPIQIAMLQDWLGGQWKAFPPQTYDQEALIAGPVTQKAAAFLYAQGVAIPSRNAATMRVVIFTADAAQPLRFLDDYGNALPIYPADGSALITQIPAAVAGGTAYYVPLTTNTVTPSSAGAWSSFCLLSPFPFTPRKE